MTILPEEMWNTGWRQGSDDHPFNGSYQHLVDGRTGNIAILWCSDAGPLRLRRKALQVLAEKVERAQELAEAQPDKAEFDWDLARTKLEAIFRLEPRRPNT